MVETVKKKTVQKEHLVDVAIRVRVDAAFFNVEQQRTDFLDFGVDEAFNERMLASEALVFEAGLGQENGERNFVGVLDQNLFDLRGEGVLDRVRVENVHQEILHFGRVEVLQATENKVVLEQVENALFGETQQEKIDNFQHDFQRA